MVKHVRAGVTDYFANLGAGYENCLRAVSTNMAIKNRDGKPTAGTSFTDHLSRAAKRGRISTGYRLIKKKMEEIATSLSVLDHQKGTGSKILNKALSISESMIGCVAIRWWDPKQGRMLMNQRIFFPNSPLGLLYHDSMGRLCLIGYNSPVEPRLIYIELSGIPPEDFEIIQDPFFELYPESFMEFKCPFDLVVKAEHQAPGDPPTLDTIGLQAFFNLKNLFAMQHWTADYWKSVSDFEFMSPWHDNPEPSEQADVDPFGAVERKDEEEEEEEEEKKEKEEKNLSSVYKDFESTLLEQDDGEGEDSPSPALKGLVGRWMDNVVSLDHSSDEVETCIFLLNVLTRVFTVSKQAVILDKSTWLLGRTALAETTEEVLLGLLFLYNVTIIEHPLEGVLKDALEPDDLFSPEAVRLATSCDPLMLVYHLYSYMIPNADVAYLGGEFMEKTKSKAATSPRLLVRQHIRRSQGNWGSLTPMDFTHPLLIPLVEFTPEGRWGGIKTTDDYIPVYMVTGGASVEQEQISDVATESQGLDGSLQVNLNYAVMHMGMIQGVLGIGKNINQGGHDVPRVQQTSHTARWRSGNEKYVILPTNPACAMVSFSHLRSLLKDAIDKYPRTLAYLSWGAYLPCTSLGKVAMGMRDVQSGKVAVLKPCFPLKLVPLILQAPTRPTSRAELPWNKDIILVSDKTQTIALTLDFTGTMPALCQTCTPYPYDAVRNKVVFLFGGGRLAYKGRMAVNSAVEFVNLFLGSKRPELCDINRNVLYLIGAQRTRTSALAIRSLAKPSAEAFPYVSVASDDSLLKQLGPKEHTSHRTCVWMASALTDDTGPGVQPMFFAVDIVGSPATFPPPAWNHGKVLLRMRHLITLSKVDGHVNDTDPIVNGFLERLYNAFMVPKSGEKIEMVNDIDKQLEVGAWQVKPETSSADAIGRASEGDQPSSAGKGDAPKGHDDGDNSEYMDADDDEEQLHDEERFHDALPPSDDQPPSKKMKISPPPPSDYQRSAEDQLATVVLLRQKAVRNLKKKIFQLSDDLRTMDSGTQASYITSVVESLKDLNSIMVPTLQSLQDGQIENFLSLMSQTTNPGNRSIKQLQSLASVETSIHRAVENYEALVVPEGLELKDHTLRRRACYISAAKVAVVDAFASIDLLRAGENIGRLTPAEDHELSQNLNDEVTKVIETCQHVARKAGIVLDVGLSSVSDTFTRISDSK